MFSVLLGEAPSSRWIVNFDNDFLDGLVFASVLAAYAPFVVSSFRLQFEPDKLIQCETISLFSIPRCHLSLS